MIEEGLNVRLLSAGPFVTMVDRFAFAPVLIPIAIDFHAPLGAVAIGATAAVSSNRQTRVGLVLEQPLVARASDPYQYGAYRGLVRAARDLHVGKG